jgi:hypothetical protein
LLVFITVEREARDDDYVLKAGPMSLVCHGGGRLIVHRLTPKTYPLTTVFNKQIITKVTMIQKTIAQ